MLEAVDKTYKMRRSKQSQTVKVGHESRVIPEAYTIRNPDAMVIEKVDTPVAV